MQNSQELITRGLRFSGRSRCPPVIVALSQVKQFRPRSAMCPMKSNVWWTNVILFRCFVQIGALLELSPAPLCTAKRTPCQQKVAEAVKITLWFYICTDLRVMADLQNCCEASGHTWVDRTSKVFNGIGIGIDFGSQEGPAVLRGVCVFVCISLSVCMCYGSLVFSLHDSRGEIEMLCFARVPIGSKFSD